MGILKKIDTIITVVGAAVSTYQLMTKTFKWYERKYGKGKDKKDITRPIIKKKKKKSFYKASISRCNNYFKKLYVDITN